MITENGINFYTYDEAANRLGTKPGYLYNLVSSGKLKSHKIGLGRKRYIAENDVNAMVNAPINDAPSVPAPFPIKSQALEAIEHVQIGYSKLSEDYKTSLEPLIRTIKDTDTEAFFNVISEMMQSIINRLYTLPSDKAIQSIPPYELLMYVTKDVDIPEPIKQHFLNVVITTVEQSVNIVVPTSNEQKVAS